MGDLDGTGATVKSVLVRSLVLKMLLHNALVVEKNLCCLDCFCCTEKSTLEEKKKKKRNRKLIFFYYEEAVLDFAPVDEKKWCIELLFFFNENNMVDTEFITHDSGGIMIRHPLL